MNINIQADTWIDIYTGKQTGVFAARWTDRNMYRLKADDFCKYRKT